MRGSLKYVHLLGLGLSLLHPVLAATQDCVLRGHLVEKVGSGRWTTPCFMRQRC